jgi:hypothetical protein
MGERGGRERERLKELFGSMRMCTTWYGMGRKRGKSTPGAYAVCPARKITEMFRTRVPWHHQTTVEAVFTVPFRKGRCISPYLDEANLGL